MDPSPLPADRFLPPHGGGDFARMLLEILECQGESLGMVDEDETFVWASPQAEPIFGVPPGGLVGHSLLTFLEEGEARRVLDQTEVRRRGERSSYELKIRRPSGEIRKIRVTAMADMDREGRYRGTIAIFRDITDTAAMEEALRQAQKLESLGLLAGGVAHDFNNLLTAVLGNLNLAQELLEEASPAAPFLAKVEQTLLRAADLTRQMLAYSGRGSFQVALLDMNQAVREIVELVKVSIPKSISLDFSLAKDLPAVEADPAQIHQALMNLVTNAAEAIGDAEGRIVVGTRTEDLPLHAGAPPFFPAQARVPDRCVVLSVSDTGCGMSRDVQERIFDPFFSTKRSGRGLGLSAMLGILKGHGAGIRIQSEPGRGSTFELFFRAQDGDPAPAVRWEMPDQAPFSGKVLLVDDEPMVLESACAALESLGFQVILAMDGVQALEKFEAEAPSLRLVLMDVTMPRMDGRKAFKAMHASHPGIPVILSSGYDKQASIEGFHHEKALAGFLQKPYRLPDLRRVLAQALERR